MNAGLPSFFTPSGDGVRLAVRLTPKSSRDAIDGVRQSADGKAFLAARVRAVPEDGKANKALEVLLAKALGVPKSSVSVVAGHTSRLKTAMIACEMEEQNRIVEKFAGF